jgi:hypothetical protein
MTDIKKLEIKSIICYFVRILMFVFPFFKETENVVKVPRHVVHYIDPSFQYNCVK